MITRRSMKVAGFMPVSWIGCLVWSSLAKFSKAIDIYNNIYVPCALLRQRSLKGSPMLRAQFFTISTLVIVSLLFPFKSKGAIVISDDITNGSGVFSITGDISYDVIGSVQIFGVVFQDWVPTVEPGNLFSFGPSLEFSLNGGVTDSASASLLDTVNIGDLDGNDGVISFSGPVVAVGDTFTLNSGNYELNAILDFVNPALSGLNFSGTTFLIDSEGFRISDFATASSVPEPSAALVLGLATALGAMRRRRSRIG